MKSGVSLQQMLTEVKRQSESKEDYLIAPNRLRMESYGKEMFLHLSDDSGTELIEPMTITGIAHRQIGTHLRIPAAYYDRMREERPDLLAYNANTWQAGLRRARWCLRNLCVEPVWQRQQRPRQSLQEYAGAVPVAQRGVYAAGDQSFAHQHQPVPRVFESGFCIPQACHLRQPCGDRLEAPDKPGGQGLQRCHVQAAWRFPRRPACFRAQVRLELP